MDFSKMLCSCENCIPNLVAVSSLYMDVKIQQNGLDKGDRKIHKYTNILRNTDTQKKNTVHTQNGLFKI